MRSVCGLAACSAAHRLESRLQRYRMWNLRDTEIAWSAQHDTMQSCAAGWHVRCPGCAALSHLVRGTEPLGAKGTDYNACATARVRGTLQRHDSRGASRRQISRSVELADHQSGQANPLPRAALQRRYARVLYLKRPLREAAPAASFVCRDQRSPHPSATRLPHRYDLARAVRPRTPHARASLAACSFMTCKRSSRSTPAHTRVAVQLSCLPMRAPRPSTTGLKPHRSVHAAAERSLASE